MKEKYIIFDSGTLISFAMNGLFLEFSKLKEIFKGKFLITNEVKKEIIDVPLGIKKFELQALKLKDLIDRGILEFPENIGINSKEVSKLSNLVMSKSNNVFFAKKKEVKIVSPGETSCLALSKILNEKGFENILAVDERTIRLLCESPEKLRELLERKIHSKVELREKNLDFFKGFSFVRSTELIVIAYKNNFILLKNNDLLLDALLWALKSTGCAISIEEIEEIKSLEKREGF